MPDEVASRLSKDFLMIGPRGLERPPRDLTKVRHVDRVQLQRHRSRVTNRLHTREREEGNLKTLFQTFSSFVFFHTLRTHTKKVLLFQSRVPRTDVPLRRRLVLSALREWDRLP